jgi:hypothetical protein|tara:strand:+ start:33 stop:155 length:123 start_codon:yes stop_codon:yes gene_type:complete
MHEQFVVALAIGSIVGCFIIDTIVSVKKLLDIQYGKEFGE